MDLSKPALSILVVEDEALTLEHICLVLSRKYPHFTIYQALDGKTGLESFELHTPGIVVTDINMPGMSGMEMVREIDTFKAGTRFIVLTGNGKKSILEDSACAGVRFDHYIEKPVFFEDLFYAIDSCVAEIMR